jgi:uncharacterized membrane protein HdeD (DUF308 family)
MLEVLARSWWLVVLRGAVSIVFGILAFIWPGITLSVLVLFFGAYVLIDGVFSLITAFGDQARGRRAWPIISGIAGILVGIATFIWPGLTALVLIYLIGIWAIIIGVVAIVTGIALRRQLTGEWLLILAGVISVVFGIVMLFDPRAGALTVIYVIAAYAVVFGILFVVLGLRLRRVRDELPASPA